MKYLSLDNGQLPYKVAKKNNKNTYFYFKKEGYIQINLSKYQNERDAINYIKNNSSVFHNKLQNAVQKSRKDDSVFMLFGKEYKVILSDEECININDENNTVTMLTTDVNNAVVKSFYKSKMLETIRQLHQQYKDNEYVDLSSVKYKTRYTNTRHGSCNASRKTINLNLYLVQYERKYIEYVYLHEIAHLKHQNHSVKYYDLLEKLCPNYKQLRKDLKRIYR